MADSTRDDIAMVLGNATPDNFINLNLSACRRVALAHLSLLDRIGALADRMEQSAKTANEFMEARTTAERICSPSTMATIEVLTRCAAELRKLKAT